MTKPFPILFPARFERSNSSSISYHDSTSNDSSNGHTPSSVASTPGGSSISGGPKNRLKSKKNTPDLGEGLDALHSEPSGWGELPSPKDTDPDNGTEVWGVPPEDLKRQQMKEKAVRSVLHQGPHPGDASTGKECKKWREGWGNQQLYYSIDLHSGFCKIRCKILESFAYSFNIG